MDLVLAAGMALPRTRRANPLPTAGLPTAVRPANVKGARDRRWRPVLLRNAACARLPLRARLVLWA